MSLVADDDAVVTSVAVFIILFIMDGLTNCGGTNQVS